MSAFKQLYAELIKNGGDFSKISPKIATKQIKCFVKESGRYFLVTDDYFYVPCYFTQKAIQDFRSKYTNINISDLKSKVIIITDWNLELNRVKSTDVFTSYAGVEIKLIVKAFKPDTAAKPVSLSRYPTNLYRDDEIKTLILNYFHSCLVKSVSGKLTTDSLPDVTKKAAANANVVSFDAGSTFSGWSFKEGKTQTVPWSQILKQEKGITTKGEGSPAKPKVVSAGAKVAKKAVKKESVKAISSKIAKFTPGGKVAKKSTARIIAGVPVMPSPGEGKTPGATPSQTMAEFKKMVDWLNKKKGKASQGKKTLGKVSQASKKIKKA